LKKLKVIQSETNLNVTLVERVAEGGPGTTFICANLWVIAYHSDAFRAQAITCSQSGAGSTISEPDGEVATIIRESDVGWIVVLCMPRELEATLRMASVFGNPFMAERAVRVARNYSVSRAARRYAGLLNELLHDAK
jgi:hypothetical protein